MPSGPSGLEEQFQRVLGRAPRPDEVSYFGKFISEEDLTPYEIGQILQRTPEYQQGALKSQGQQYADILAQSDSEVLNRAQDNIRSNFYRVGRPQSSGYLGAYSQAARDLALNRQSLLAGFYGQGINEQRQQSYDQGQQAAVRSYGLRDERRQRAYQLEDYYRQQNDFNTYLNSERRRSRGRAFGRLGGNLIGGYIGQSFGPGGMIAGARLGGEVGGILGG